MKKVKLHDICRLERGSSPRPIQNYITTAKDGVNWVKIGDTDSNEKYVTRTAEKITKEGAKKSRKVEIGDFILSNSMSLGHPFIMNIDGYIHDGWFVLRPDYTKVDQEFLYYTLLSDYVQTQFKGTCTGSVVKNIRSELVNDLDIFLPELPVQKQIAKILTDIDSKIAMNNKINKELEVMAKELYEYWFVQFDFPNEEGKPYKSSGGKMKFNSILKRDIPEGWDVKKLGNLFETNRGVSYSTPTLSDSGTPMINLASFSPDNSYNEKGIKYFIGEYSNDKILKPYDLVMCNTQQTAINYATDIIGRSMLIPDIFDSVEIVSSHHVNTIKLENDIYKFWMNHLFNSEYFHRYIAYYASGTNIMGLSFNGVTDFEIAIPTEKLLKEFNKFAFDIEKKKSLIIRENNHLLYVRDELLPMLMNGQVSVKE